MYKLKKGEHIAITDKEYKKEAFLKLGFELVKETKKAEKKESKEDSK